MIAFALIMVDSRVNGVIRREQDFASCIAFFKLLSYLPQQAVGRRPLRLPL